MELKAKEFGRVPTAKLRKAPWNYKVDDPEKAKKLTANIERNGQVENLIVRPIARGVFEVINGNHRLDSLMLLGIKEAVVYNTGKISDAAARRLAIETNETKFDTDPLRLADLLGDIVAEFSDDSSFVETFPIPPAEIEAFMDLSKYTAPDAPKDGKKGKQIDNAFLKEEVDAAKLLSTLGVSKLSKEDAETIAMAVMEEKAAMGIHGANPRVGGQAAFLNIFKKYLEAGEEPVAEEEEE